MVGVTSEGFRDPLSYLDKEELCKRIESVLSLMKAREWHIHRKLGIGGLPEPEIGIIDMARLNSDDVNESLDYIGQGMREFSKCLYERELFYAQHDKKYKKLWNKANRLRRVIIGLPNIVEV